MSKLQKLRKAFERIVSQPSLLNLILNENEVRKAEHLAKYPGVESLPQISFRELTNNFDVEVETFILDGSSLPTDLALLKILAKERNSYFEIGTWRGESVWNVSKIIEDCTTFNLSKKEIQELGYPPKYAELHGFLSHKNQKIKHLEGNTKIYDFASMDRKFDLLFIDGDHTYAMVKNDTEKIFRHLVHENSVVVWHDYAYNPEKIRYEVFTGILDGLPAQFHDSLYHVANTMCAVYIPKKFKTQTFESPKTPEFLFEVKLKLKP